MSNRRTLKYIILYYSTNTLYKWSENINILFLIFYYFSMPGKMTVLNDDELLKACRRLQPGEFFSFDYRSPKQLEYNQNLIKLSEKVQQGGLSHDEKALLRPLKVMTWNIERGYKLKDIICHIKAADPDIICIQEIDSGCDRSFNVDTGIAIARALNLNYIFQLEFIELHSASASADPTFHGVHGNGIMSKFDFGESFSLDHPTQVCFYSYSFDS